MAHREGSQVNTQHAIDVLFVFIHSGMSILGMLVCRADSLVLIDDINPPETNT